MAYKGDFIMAWMAFLSVLAILGIVLVGGGLIAFLIHMILGAFDSGKNAENTNVNTSKEVIDYKEFKQLENANTVDKEYDFEAIDEAKAESEKKLAENDETKEDIFDLDNTTDEEDIAQIEERLKSENVESSEDDDLSDLLDEIANDVVDEEKDKIQEENAPKMDEKLESYSIDDYLKTINEDNTEESEVVEETEEEETELVETEPVVVEAKSNEELDNANQVIADLKAQLESLNAQLALARTANKTEVAIDMTEDECVARLETLEERLKNAKREYKINGKEYRPLKKVMNDLERNQTKLRRREAVVAKKKVALYGVNNYVDIDKEKAEQLANEIELLEGLRLSVQHCEEVINESKDRYPILEHTNNILEEQISQLEADIERTNIVLQKIRDKKGNGEK